MRILFVAPNPNKQDTHEGYLHRVMEIDRLFEDHDKVYIDDLDSDQIAIELERANIVYVHSIYQADRVRSLYKLYGEKIITDLHGVVPEEEEYMGHLQRSQYLSVVEGEVFRYSNSFVAVTKAMKKHFNEKYKNTKNRKWVILPIYGSIRKTTHKQSRLSVIYAGGAQAWQNVPLMIEAINSRKDIPVTILTQDIGAFKHIDPRRESDYTIKTVPSSEVGKHYERVSLGFAIRKDSTVNRVACPTKLVEYIANGIVPVVDSVHIGDFASLGYKFITLEDFKSDNFSMKSIQMAQKDNLKVYEKLVKITDQGKNDLLNLVRDIPQMNVTNKKDRKLAAIQELVSVSIKFSDLSAKLTGIESEKKHLQEKIQEYATSIEYLAKESESLRVELEGMQQRGLKGLLNRWRGR